jgi:Phospholipase_D-nuclease N-terminal
MKLRQVLSIVPKPVKVTASIIMGCVALVGPVAGFVAGRVDGRGPVHGFPFPLLTSVGGLCFGLLAGVLMSLWVLGLGYVYADAERRNMPSILWTLVAALVPNLLGYLLYFVLRKPIAVPCPNCGQATDAAQRFCPWCGYHEPATSSSKDAAGKLGI